MKAQLFAGALPLLFAAACAQAQVTVKDPWARATVPAAKASGAFMQVQSAQDARIVGVKAEVAAMAELHQMAMENDVMKMAEVAAIELPAGKPVQLAPGGLHVMLMGLKRQLKEGDTLPLTLVVETRDKKRVNVDVKVPVKALTYSPAK